MEKILLIIVLLFFNTSLNAQDNRIEYKSTHEISNLLKIKEFDSSYVKRMHERYGKHSSRAIHYVGNYRAISNKILNFNKELDSMSKMVYNKNLSLDKDSICILKLERWYNKECQDFFLIPDKGFCYVKFRDTIIFNDNLPRQRDDRRHIYVLETSRKIRIKNKRH